MVITATRGTQPLPTLRDTVVITRDELEDAGAVSRWPRCCERRAGVELRATGGPGQPTGHLHARRGRGQHPRADRRAARGLVDRGHHRHRGDPDRA